MKKILYLFPILSIVSCNQNVINNNYDYFTFDFTDSSLKDLTNDNSEKFNSTMLSYLNKDNDLVSSVSTLGYVQIRTEPQEAEEDIKSLRLCSGSKDGSISFTFKVDIVSIIIKAQSYYKSYLDTYTIPGESYVVYSSDLYSSVYVNNEEWILPYFSYESKTAEEENKEFNINSTTFTLSGVSAQRAFIKSITIKVNK